MRRIHSDPLAVLFAAAALPNGIAVADETASAPLAAALDVARHLREKPPSPGSLDLYSGAPGRLFFFLEAWKAGADPENLAAARALADELVAGIDRAATARELGLYTGIAGVGAALLEAHRVTGDKAYADGVRRVVAALEKRAVKHHGDGARWNFTTDVISGTAGIGLFLLEAARALDLPAARDLAVRAGKSLLGSAEKSPAGLEWAMQPFAPYDMPNFSHGTAGIAYFLATLYGETNPRRAEFLDAAIAGANHLLAIANRDDGGLVVHHYTASGNTGGFLLGWCHGPPGTARLFERLSLVTGDPSWKTWMLRGARSVVDRGEKSKHLWDNSSLCCGTAGVGDFFLDLYRSTGDATWLDHARTLAKDILSRGRRDASGLAWAAPSRTAHPGEPADAIGLMQGSSGIGLFLLRLDAAEKKRELAVRLPDTPFR